MTDRSRGAARGGTRTGAVLFLAILALLATTVGCGGRAAPDGDEPGIRRMLERRAAAALRHDTDAFLETVDPAASGYRSQQRQLIRNLADVPLRSWRYRLTGTGGFTPAGGDGRRVAAEVRLSYRLGFPRPRDGAGDGAGAGDGRAAETAEAAGGYAEAPVRVVQRLTLTERDGSWFVAAEDRRGADARQAPQQLWDQGKVTVVRGRYSLVLGVGRDQARLREVARTADRAVPAVSGSWRGQWARRVVVLVPRTRAAMAALLGAPEAGYRRMAAVTTGEAGGPGAARTGRVIVNPQAYDALGDRGRRIVLTHETTHLATRAYTPPGTPLWLSEGFADWVGLSGTGRTSRQGAPALARRLAAGHGPGLLPEDEDFGFGGDGDRLAQSYERGWLACRMIAERWGERAPADLYRSVGAAGEDDDALDAALRSELGLSPAQFTAQWQAYVTRELS